MAKATKYLKNRRTGAVFVHTETLAKNPLMVPCDKEGNSAFDEVTADIAGGQKAKSQTPPDPGNGEKVLDEPDQPDPDEPGKGEGEGDNGKAPEPEPVMIGEKPLEKASKAEVIAFVKTATGIQIEDSLKVAEVREQAAKILAEADEE